MRTKEKQEQYIDNLKKRLRKDYHVVIEPYMKKIMPSYRFG